eukprot:SAG11_NODE_31992_length_287_cov_0.829787_2_plen_43_part_01
MPQPLLQAEEALHAKLPEGWSETEEPDEDGEPQSVYFHAVSGA